MRTGCLTKDRFGATPKRNTRDARAPQQTVARLRAPQTQRANQSPPLKPAQPKNTEQPARDRRRLRNGHPIYLNVID